MSETTAHFDPHASWVLHLEHAHTHILSVIRFLEEESEPSEHVTNAAEQIQRGLGALYDAFDGRTDRMSAVGRAHGRVWEAAVSLARDGLSTQLAHLRDACRSFVLAEQHFPRVKLVSGQTKTLRASIDRPPRHSVERDSLVPTIRTPPLPPPRPAPAQVEIPQPKTFEELAAARESLRLLAQEKSRAALVRAKAPAPALPVVTAQAEPPPGFAYVPDPPLSEQAFVRRATRLCFEEIGMLAMQRVPLEGDDWRANQSLELRLLTALDALVALGPTALAYVETLALDAPSPDPLRMFGAATIGGCVAGRDALAMAERVLARFGAGDPLIADAFVTSMKVATNEFVENAMRLMSRSSDRAYKLMGVEVMAYRGWFTAEELDELADEADAQVFALVLPALAKARHRALDRAVSRGVLHDNLDVRLAAVDALALAAHPRAARYSREAAEGELGDRALVPLAMVGDEQDALWLFERMKRATTVASIDAVGWAGLIDAVPALIGVLETGDDDCKLAAGAALDRMLGANLLEEVEIAPEELDDIELVDPNPEPLTGRLALADIVSDPRDKPQAGSTDTIEVPSTDAALWRAYWAEHAATFQKGQRVRRGRAYSAEVVLYELRELALSANDRRRLGRELAMRTGKRVEWDVEQFVGVQVGALML